MFELFNPQVAVENIGPLLGGLLITVELTLVVIVLSLVFALFVALGGMSRITPLRWLVKAYVEVIRGTPLLLQLIYVYYVLPEIGIRLDAFTAGVLALTLNYSAYISEVYRGGIQAIPRGQHDAAAALGMTHPLSMRRIILPQAARVIVPPLGNEFNNMLKTSSLVFTIGVYEMFSDAEIHYSNTFLPEFFIAVAFWYLFLTSIWTIIQGWIERRLAVSDRDERLTIRERFEAAWSSPATVFRR